MGCCCIYLSVYISDSDFRPAKHLFWLGARPTTVKVESSFKNYNLIYAYEFINVDIFV